MGTWTGRHLEPVERFVWIFALHPACQFDGAYDNQPDDSVLKPLASKAGPVGHPNMVAYNPWSELSVPCVVAGN